MVYFCDGYYPEIRNYSHQRIKQILCNDYHIELVAIEGYKINRYYKQTRYNLICMDTGEMVMTEVTLNALRIILSLHNYPLKDDD